MISQKTRNELITILSTLDSKQRKILLDPLIDLYDNITKDAIKTKSISDDKLHFWKGLIKYTKETMIHYSKLNDEVKKLRKHCKKQDRKVKVYSKWINKKCKKFLKRKNKKLNAKVKRMKVKLRGKK